MNSQFKNTCILYFTTQLESEKLFSSHKRKQKAVQKVLFEKTLGEIQQSGLAYVISDGKTYGQSFGERIKGAAEGIFQLGYENLIIVGDDTPHLSAINLLQAQKNLEAKILTLGPSSDGGSYLISVSKDSFHKGILENLEWQSHLFHEQLISNFELFGAHYQLLQTFIDLDNEIAINIYLNQPHHSTIQKILSNILSEEIEFTTDFLTEDRGLIIQNTDRGPPLVIQSS
nr:DUF2064 domain-containing protein [Pseudopedobacter sp.]